MHENGSSRRNYGPIISLIDNILVLGEIRGPDDHGWFFGVLSHLLSGYTKVDSYSMKQENDKDDKRKEEHNLRLWGIGATRQNMQSICFLFRARSTLIGRVSSNQFFNGLHVRGWDLPLSPSASVSKTGCIWGYLSVFRFFSSSCCFYCCTILPYCTIVPCVSVVCTLGVSVLLFQIFTAPSGWFQQRWAQAIRLPIWLPKSHGEFSGRG